jgi:hypothetical protein
MKRLALILAALWPTLALAQAPTAGPLLIQRGLGEIAQQGSAAQAQARASLNLGGAATLNVGTTAGTVADGGALTAETAARIAAIQSALPATAGALLGTSGTAGLAQAITPGTGLVLSSGILSVPAATSSVLGGVKQGANVSIAGDGTLSASGAVQSVAGLTGTPTAAQIAATMIGTTTGTVGDGGVLAATQTTANAALPASGGTLSGGSLSGTDVSAAVVTPTNGGAGSQASVATVAATANNALLQAADALSILPGVTSIAEAALATANAALPASGGTLSGGSLSGTDVSAATALATGGTTRQALATLAVRNGLLSPKPVGLSSWVTALEGTYSTPPIYGESIRALVTTRGPISLLQLFLPEQTAASAGGVEIAQPNPVAYLGCVEYPLGVANTNQPCFTLRGSRTMWSATVGTGQLTDKLGVIIPAGTQFAIRFGTYVAAPPAALAAAGLTTGGTLAAATYYYKETCLVPGLGAGVESGPTAEQSVTTTGATSSVTLTATATADPLGCAGGIKIYRSTTTGAETYLATLPAPGLVYIDTGAVGTTAGATPPAAATYSYNGNLPTGFSGTGSSCGGTQANAVVGTGAMPIAGLNTCYTSLPIVLGNDAASIGYCGAGDSIQAGTGVISQTADIPTVNTTDPRGENWFAAAFHLGTYNILNFSLPSAEMQSFTGGGFPGGAMRLRMMDFCDTVVTDLSTNDLYVATLSRQTVAANLETFAAAESALGKKVIVTTMLPRGLSTDDMIVPANFTPSSLESSRQAYNAWLRAGAQWLAGAPVTSGGVPTGHFAGIFDLAATLEVNVSNVPTLGGSYWLSPSVPYGTGTIASGSSGSMINYTTASWLGGSNASNAMPGMVMKMTSGADAGQVCRVYGNTTSYILCQTGLTVASLSVGDAFAVYKTYGYDGTHPTYYGGLLIDAGNGGAQGFTAYVAANLPPN